MPKTPQSQKLDSLTPSQRALFILWALSDVESKDSLNAYLPASWQLSFEPLGEEELTLKLLKAYLQKMIVFGEQSYFLGIHDSWLEALSSGYPRTPALLEILKTKLLRLSQYDDLMTVGKRELASYLVALGKFKAAQLMAPLPKEIQTALIEAMGDVPKGAKSSFDFGFLFKFNFVSAE
ncbi:MAG: hypothetical protein JKY15_02205, partial [Deltaproteobacteria bacterium]|nr:hypothetical protein [Deltaproteobacteria bacterium]